MQQMQETQVWSLREEDPSSQDVVDAKLSQEN